MTDQLHMDALDGEQTTPEAKENAKAIRKNITALVRMFKPQEMRDRLNKEFSQRKATEM